MKLDCLKTILYHLPMHHSMDERYIEPIPIRQAEILDFARKSGRVGVEPLAEQFKVTPQTIRKDLNDLCNRGLLHRVHGGAVVSSGVSNVGYGARRTLAAEAKQQIGRKAAGLIPDDCSIIINIGTTTEQVALALRARVGLRVITNNINVVNILHGHHDIEVIVTGGSMRHSDGGIVGEAAVELIQQFRVDYAIIGVSAIEDDGSLLDYDYNEVKVAQAIIRNARSTILVADSMKFERTAPVRIGHLSLIDTLVTDQPLSREYAQICVENNVNMVIAGEVS